MTREEVEDFVREGDVVVVRTVVLEVLCGGAIRTHSLHAANDVRAHERVFRAGDLVRNRAGAGSIAAAWRIVHVHGGMAWIEQNPRDPGNKGFLWGTDDLVHAIPGVDMRVDTSSSL